MTQPILCVEDLSVGFRQESNATEVVKNVSFELSAGRTLALVGESGSGKSITAHSIMGLLPYPMAFHSSGKVLLDDEDILEADESVMQRIRGNRIGMIFQEPMTALNPLHKIEKQIAEVVCQHRGLRQREAKAIVAELLQRVQIPRVEAIMASYPHELSGGQRQRIMIAMALANEPNILIADEPTTALDVTVQREVLELLNELRSTHNLALLLITHDLGVVRHMANDVLVMHKGKIVERGNVETIFTNPQHEYTQTLLQSSPKGEPSPLPQGNAKPLLRVADLKVSFTTKKSLFGRVLSEFTAVKGISFDVSPGETLGVVGESGSGKSTLAFAVLRLVNSRGDIVFDGAEISALSQRALRPLRHKIQVVFQDPFASLSPRMTVAEIITEGLSVHTELTASEKEDRLLKVMAEVGLDETTRNRYPHEFSGGQRQRIAIARAIILEPKLLILDEPTSALDRAVQVQVLELLKALQVRRQLSYLFISHDLSVIKALSHRVMVIKDGEVVEMGPAAQVLEQPRESYTQDLLEASF
ncbi:MAG: microcin ABC transporter ATP-binding protein [Cellvibrionaceae bacterium]|nr:microcin ABC transporter ATP-binding protein [Cellvibrionaceae bacterium]